MARGVAKIWGGETRGRRQHRPMAVTALLEQPSLRETIHTQLRHSERNRLGAGNGREAVAEQTLQFDRR